MSMAFQPDRLTLTGIVVLAISLGYFVKFSKRRYREWYRVQHPGSYKQEYGRYYGRYALSGFGIFAGLVLLLLGMHLATWIPMTPSTKVAEVDARRDGGKMELSIASGRNAPRTLTLDGNHWILRSEILAFHPKLGLLGLGRYCRVRFVDGLARPEDRIQGAHASREEFATRSLVYSGFRWVGRYLGPLVRTREEVSPAKPPAGHEAIWVLEGGSAG